MNVVLLIIVVAIFVCDRTKASGKLATAAGILALCYIAHMQTFDQGDLFLRIYVSAELVFTFINLGRQNERRSCPSEQNCSVTKF